MFFCVKHLKSTVGPHLAKAPNQDPQKNIITKSCQCKLLDLVPSHPNFAPSLCWPKEGSIFPQISGEDSARTPSKATSTRFLGPFQLAKMWRFGSWIRVAKMVICLFQVCLGPECKLICITMVNNVFLRIILAMCQKWAVWHGACVCVSQQSWPVNMHWLKKK